MSDDSMLGFGLVFVKAVLWGMGKVMISFRVRSLVRVGEWIRVTVNVTIKMFMF
jgi:hypothetical protein